MFLIKLTETYIVHNICGISRVWMPHQTHHSWCSFILLSSHYYHLRSGYHHSTSPFSPPLLGCGLVLVSMPTSSSCKNPTHTRPSSPTRPSWSRILGGWKSVKGKEKQVLAGKPGSASRKMGHDKSHGPFLSIYLFYSIPLISSAYAKLEWFQPHQKTQSHQGEPNNHKWGPTRANRAQQWRLEPINGESGVEDRGEITKGEPWNEMRGLTSAYLPPSTWHRYN